jgi:SAM-dependent methyltransferase
VVWHDVECGAYAEDLSLWRALASERGGPVLDVGAGTGRVALDLGRRGFAVTALDLDAELLDELSARARAEALPVDVVVADARSFTVSRRYPLCIVPMQTLQLLGDAAGRASFLRCARRALVPGGLLAVAIVERLECFEVASGEAGPLPDIRELDGVVYASRPVAVRETAHGFVLERLRETIRPSGDRTVEQNEIVLDRITPEELEREATAAGFAADARGRIPPTFDYAGSTVVMLVATAETTGA